MKAVLIACSMVRREVECAMEETEIRLPVIWLERGLHNDPKHLKQVLQEEITRCEDQYDIILLAYCFCGGALEGLCSQRAKLVFPAFPDCIEMLLHTRGKPSTRRPDALYFTSAWTVDERFIAHEYDAFCKKHGSLRTQKVYRSILRGYHAVIAIDTGCEAFDALEGIISGTAEKLQLAYGTQRGSDQCFLRLLSGDWKEDFYIAERGEPVTLEHYMWIVKSRAIHTSNDRGLCQQHNGDLKWTVKKSPSKVE